MSENTFSNRVKCTTDSELFLSYQFLVGRMKVGGWGVRMKKNAKKMLKIFLHTHFEHFF